MADANMYIMNPVFQAESFNEMVQPLTLYALAYKEQEAKIEDMTDKAAALEWIANQDPESQTAALYRDMSDKIKGLRDNIMTNGLTGGLRSQVLGARRMYSANSAEITRRYEDMKAYRDRMAALQDKDSSMVFSPESQNVSLDDFAGGKRPKIKAISGNEVMARGAAVGKRLTSLIFGDGVVGQEMGGLFWKIYQEQGMTDEALWKALSSVGLGNETKFKMAKQVIDGIYNSFSDFDPVDQQTLKNKFIEGVYSGSVYNRQIDYKDNGEYMNKAQRESLALQKADSARQDMQLDLQALTAGYRREGNKWVFDPQAAMLNAAMAQAKKSGSGSGSGSGSANHIGEHPAVFMSGDDDSPMRAYVSNGAAFDKSEGNRVDKGHLINFEYNPVTEKITMKCGKVTLADYNPKTNEIDPVSNELAKTINDNGINGSFYNINGGSKKNWSKHDAKLLRNLGRCAWNTMVINDNNPNALVNYVGKFKPDADSWSNNGSMYYGPIIDRSSPINNEIYNSSSYNSDTNIDD